MLASGSVNVTTLVRCCDVAPETAQADVKVLSINADGMLGGMAVSDAQGKASVPVKEGATVIAIYPEDTNFQTQIVAYVGVKPNDALTFGDKYFSPPGAGGGATGTVTLNYALVTGATNYYAYSPCSSPSSTTGTITLGLDPSCQTATAPVLLVATNANGKAIASVFLPTAAYTPNATITVASNQWVANTVDNTMASISGLPATVNEVDFDITARFPPFSWSDSNYVYPVTGGAASVSVTQPGGASASYAQARVYRNNYRRQDHYKGGAAPFTFPAPTLPWLSGVVFDQETLQGVWIQTAGTYDAGIVEFNWSESISKGPTHYFRWRIFVPPGKTEFSFGATPPAQLADYLPDPGTGIGYDVTLVDLSSAASYDAARALPEWRLADPSNSVYYGDEPLAAETTTDGGEGFAFTHH